MSQWIVAADAVSTDDDLRAAAGIASLALTLLTFFTNLRREHLREYLKDAESLSLKTVRDAVPDVVLALLTGGAAVALTPLLLDTFAFDQIGKRAGTVATLFGLIWLGFVAVFVFQLWTVIQRFWAAYDAGRNVGPTQEA